jgi:hypothetical protein
MKAKHVIQRETKRVETLAKVRKNALNAAQDTKARQILKEKRDRTNEREFKKY